MTILVSRAHFDPTNFISFTIGSETEVTRDFVFEPPQATIGLQRSTLPDDEGHCCTALFVFCGSDLTYVTAPFYYPAINTSVTNNPPPKIKTKTTTGHTKRSQWEYRISSICKVAITNPVGAKNNIAYCPN